MKNKLQRLESYFGNEQSCFLEDLSNKYLNGSAIYTVVFYDRDGKESTRLDGYSFRNIVWDFISGYINKKI